MCLRVDPLKDAAGSPFGKADRLYLYLHFQKLCRVGEHLASYPGRLYIGQTDWQLTKVQTAYGYDVKEITAPPVQAMNIG